MSALRGLPPPSSDPPTSDVTGTGSSYLSTGTLPTTFPSLETLLAQHHSPRSTGKARVCLITFALVGPIKNGGIATADTALAEALATSGHPVTVLYLWGRGVQSGKMESWVEAYRERGITVVPLPASAVPLSPSSPSKYVTKAYEAYQWLLAREHEFDVIHMHEWHGPGYYITLAKRQGSAFHRSLLVTTVHCPALFYLAGNYGYLNSFNYLASDFLEREQVSMSDVVLSPSQYMLGWAQEQGWSLPRHTYVQQNLLASEVMQWHEQLGGVSASSRGRVSLTELVFFARFEVLKGLYEFCDALDLLAADVRAGTLPHLNVTFMGNPNLAGSTSATDYISARAQAGEWPFRPLLLTDMLQPEAVAYLLAEEGRVAILPSLVENSPYAVLECLALGIPFLASDVGGVPELIHPADRPSVLFRPSGQAIADSVRRAVRDGGVAVARPSVPPTQTRDSWLRLHSVAASLLPEAMPLPLPPSSSSSPSSSWPMATVCIIHHERGELLLQTLNAALSLDYPEDRMEIVLVDDGSVQPQALQVLDTAAALFDPSSPATSAARPGDRAYVPWVGVSQQARAKRTPFRLIRQENLYPGAARNAAAQAASGEFIAFLDDDDIPKAAWLSTLIAVAQRTEADVVTCMCDFFSGRFPAAEGRTVPQLRWLPLGAAADLGLFHNVFGAYAAAFRRASFLRLSGYSTERGSTYEDYEIFAKAVLAGMRLQLVPQALLWYRQPDRSSDASGSRVEGVAGKHLLRTTNTYTNRMRALRPYLQAVPPHLRNALLMGYGTVKTTKGN